jgi:hypothetical protein
MAIDNEARTSRRGILAAALGGAGLLAASKLSQPGLVSAADTDPALMGTANVSTTETGFQNTDAGEVSVHATQTTGTALQGTVTDGDGVNGAASGTGRGVVAGAASGKAFAGDSTTGTGAWIRSLDTTPTTFADGSHKTGVLGTAGDDTNISTNTDETGVYGFSDTSSSSNGVWGDSFNGTGVYGTGWYYPPYVSPYAYYPRPVTYGMSVSYNPYTGWGFGFTASN